MITRIHEHEELADVDADTIVRFDSVTKVFAGVTALNGVSLSIRRGEVHALCGENGAGKSTLGRVLAGIHRPDAGEVHVAGTVRHFHSPADASRAGVSMVHQELAFCPALSVAENLCLGAYPRRFGVLIDRRQMREQARRMLHAVGATIDVRLPMRRLSTAQEQLVQIAAAVGTGASILIFDEPTSSLSESDARRLFALMRDLKQRGVTMIYVSHRLAEVLELADRVSVLRDGRLVGTADNRDLDERKLVSMMTGRQLESRPIRPDASSASGTALRVRGLSSPGRFEDVSFDLHGGEIVGLAGLVGSGRTEVATAIFGLDPHVRGAITLDNHPLKLHDVRHAMRRGIALAPEDRKRQGLVLGMSARKNCSMAILDRLSWFGFLNRREERDEAKHYCDMLAVKAPSIETVVRGLSGGNQQKVVLAKWLARGAKVLIVDEPTRGIDVGAKAAIHELLDELASRGVAVLLISSELTEVLALSSRVLVMREGRLVGGLPRHAATEQAVMNLMAGV